LVTYCSFSLIERQLQDMIKRRPQTIDKCLKAAVARDARSVLQRASTQKESD
jgi:hypothetical protein